MKKSFIFLTLGIFLTGFLSLLGLNISPCQAEGETEAPNITITKQVTRFTNDTTPDVGLIASSGSDFEVKNGDAILGSGIGTGEEQTITLAELADGDYQLLAIANLGEQSTTASLENFTVDTISPTINIGEDILTNKKTALNAQADDSSGINITSWEQLSGPGSISFDNSSSLTTEFEADADGSYVLRLTAIDNAGNNSAKTLNVEWDTAPPVISGVENGKIYNADITPNFIGHGTLDGESFISGEMISVEGAHTLIVADDAGNQTAVVFRIDKTPPGVSISRAPDKDLYNDPYNITINFSDDCVKRQYKIDSGEWQDYTEPIEVSTEGDHTIYAKATDEAGNESETSTAFSIDLSSPTVSVELNPNASVHNGDYTITVDFGDSVLKQYMMDEDEDWREYTGPIVVSAEGFHVLYTRGTDEAGNEDTLITTFTIDKTVPEIILSREPNTDLFNGDYTITIDFDGATEGKQYKLDDGEWQDYTGSITISDEGNHTIIARGSDNAGNIGYSNEISFMIDKTSPIISDLGLKDNINRENEHLFIITGKTEANLTITCKIGEDTFTTFSDENGDFTFLLDFSTYDDGSITLKIKTIDEAGNESEEIEKNIIKDTSISAPEISATNIDDSNINSFSITGKAEPDAEVIVSISDSVHEPIIKTVMANSEGEFTIADLDLSSLSNGEIKISAKQKIDDAESAISEVFITKESRVKDEEKNESTDPSANTTSVTTASGSSSSTDATSQRLPETGMDTIWLALFSLYMALLIKGFIWSVRTVLNS